MRTFSSLLTNVALSVLLLSPLGCGSDDDENGGSPSPAPTGTRTPAPTVTPTGDRQLDISICAPDAGPFSATIDHPFFSLPVRTEWILEGEDDKGAEVRVEITSLDETEAVAGVTTRVVEEREWEDGELIEVSRNFFVRAPDGTVCYYGEDVDIYEDGEVVSHEGAWRAGDDGNQPGILMPANPALGQLFQQELAPGIAEDEAEIVAVGEAVEVPLGSFDDTVRFLERNPLDGDTSTKVYARDVGLLVDDELERVPEEPAG